MANLLDYVNWRADLLFSMDPFNTVDNVIFSEISYMDYENIVPSFPSLDKITFNKATTTIFKAVDKKDMVLGLILPYEVINLADAMKSTNRYSKVYLSNYINKTSKKEKIQFLAMCFHINKNLIYIAFRGTDDT